MKAAEVPLETARWCAEVASSRQSAPRRATPTRRATPASGRLARGGGGKGAAYNVRINVSAMPDKAAGTALAEEAQRLVAAAADAAKRATAAVEAHL
jgi:formiminotetrahydrofolate cyclodeaminase